MLKSKFVSVAAPGQSSDFIKSEKKISLKGRYRDT